MSEPSFFERYLKFVTRDIWILEFSTLSWGKQFLIRQVKIVYIVVRGFLKDNCPLRASALTYSTLLSLVPLLAFAFSLAKGFKVDMSPLQNWIVEKIALGNRELGGKIFSYVSNINATTLGLPALGILVFSIISVMNNIEVSFNQIWGVAKGRSVWRMFSDYLSVLIVTPLLVLAGVGITGSLQSHQVVNHLLRYEIFRTAWWTVLKIVSYLLPCLGFTFLYVFMPNTRVRLKSAFIGGLIAGVIWQLALWGYVAFQVGVLNYTRLYGAMATIFVNLVWIYVSWLIVLFGAEISFAVQNVNTYQWEEGALYLSWAYQETVAFNLLERISRRFLRGEPPATAEGLATELKVPIRLVNQLLRKMAEGGLVSEVIGEGRPYHPAQDLHRMTVAKILNCLRNAGSAVAIPPFLNDSALVSRVRGRIEKAIREAGGAVTMEELLKNDQARNPNDESMTKPG